MNIKLIAKNFKFYVIVHNRGLNTKSVILRQIITTFLKDKGKAIILKASKDKEFVAYNQHLVRPAAYFSWETMEARGE